MSYGLGVTPYALIVGDTPWPRTTERIPRFEAKVTSP
jgi:hypothetical protein